MKQEASRRKPGNQQWLTGGRKNGKKPREAGIFVDLCKNIDSSTNTCFSIKIKITTNAVEIDFIEGGLVECTNETLQMVMVNDF